MGRASPDHLDLADARAVLDADHMASTRSRSGSSSSSRCASCGRPGQAAADESRDGDADEPDESKQASCPCSPTRATAPSSRWSARPVSARRQLGESVARALGRPFVRVAVGGVRDEAEIRGHRRTYVGAQPGRIVRAITEAGTMNPVVLLDEVDKVGADWRGDPSSALLEVLDPAQNHTFRDHYLELDLDLSDVLFIATANVLDTIPGPLLDRMEIVRLDGYTEDEKVAIATRPPGQPPGRAQRAARRRGDVTDAALHALVADYTREAGVRGLERQLGKVAAQGRAPGRGRRRHATGRSSTPTISKDYARPAALPAEVADAHRGARRGDRSRGHGRRRRRAVRRGDVHGMDGEPGLHVTGQLGDVMKESAQIALSFVRSHRGGARGADRRVRAPALPRALPGRCGAQGRSVGGHHDDDRAGRRLLTGGR